MGRNIKKWNHCNSLKKMQTVVSKSPLFLFRDKKVQLLLLLFFFWTHYGRGFREIYRVYVSTIIFDLQHFCCSVENKLLDFRFAYFRFLEVHKRISFQRSYLSNTLVVGNETSQLDLSDIVLHVALRSRISNSSRFRDIKLQTQKKRGGC